MRRYPLRTAAVATALSAMLVACGMPPRLDATSYESLNASLNAARESLFAKDVKRFDQARQDFNAAYFASGKDTARDPRLPDWRVVHDMTPSEFFSYVKTLNPVEPLPAMATFPDPALATRLLTQYRLEHELLMQNKQRLLDSGKNTLDQFPVVDFAYLPPMTDVPLEHDKAAFLVSIDNRSGFDAYRPKIRISIRDPKDPLPILERTFEHSSGRNAIAPDERVTMRFECCSLGLDPLHNRLLKELAPDSSIEVELLQVKSGNGLDLIDPRTFSLADSQRLKVLELCIQRIAADVAGWVPYAEDDQPGGCGDPNQAENLLTMWEQQGLKPPEAFAHLVFNPTQAKPAAASEKGAAPRPPTAASRPLATGKAAQAEQPSTPDPTAGAPVTPATDATPAPAASGSRGGVGSPTAN